MNRVRVHLHGIDVGSLEGRPAVFRFDPGYWDLPDRPVLGQWFEDSARDDLHAGPGLLPAWFANLLPEGDLAAHIERRLTDRRGDEIDLLVASGHDLAGAVSVASEIPLAKSLRTVVQPTEPIAALGALAGVQLKVPVSVDRHDRMTIPLSGQLSGWLLKIPPVGKYRDLAPIEFATMKWAALAGFDAPEVALRDLTPELMEGESPRLSLLVRRYDRDDNGAAIHQEDLCQALGLDPQQKYPVDSWSPPMPDADSEARRRVFTTAEGLAALSRRLLGESGAREYIRRLVLIVATGNGDAHLKNWSVLYPDRRRATWAPVYDQVCLLPWDNTLALPWFGVMNYAAINQALLVRVGAEGQLDAATTLAELDVALERLSKAWPMVRDRFPAHVRGLLRAHWRKTPLLSSHQLA